MNGTSIAASLNLLVRFVSELAALVALGVWGYHVGSGPVSRVVLAIAMPLAMAAVWGAVVAPRAWRRASDPARLVVELGIFAAATAALAASAGSVLASGFAVVVAVNIALMFAWRQRTIA